MAIASFNKTTLKRQLRKGSCNVTFKKATDGKIRKMACTLNVDMIPKRFQNDLDSPEPRGIIRVYDLEKKGFRSFRTDSVRNCVVDR